MNHVDGTEVVAAPASSRTGRTHPWRGLVGTGLVAALAAMAATTLAAALAQAVGVDFVVHDGARRSRCPGSPW